MRELYFAAVVFFVASFAACARCVVTDPTGTHLNIRATPNGEIVGTLRNGAVVNVKAYVYDSRGRPWANIGVGWIYREFISCY